MTAGTPLTLTEQMLRRMTEERLREVRDMLTDFVQDGPPSPHHETWLRLLHVTKEELGRRYGATASAPASGCCGECQGTGSSPKHPETNGLCWDCRGTGHTHLLGEECDGGAGRMA